VPEAEDVLLEAAERATWAIRAVWERRRGTPNPGERAAASAAQRRLAAWQTAWLGRSWPVATAIARAAPGPLARRIRRLPPWTDREGSVPFTDGRQIWLPRMWLEEPGEGGFPHRALLTTLGLARRLARRSVVAAPAHSLARDLWWLAEGALGDVALAHAWPGLAPALRAIRHEALETRPRLARLHPVEQTVERWVRTLLAASPEQSARALVDGLEPRSDPAAIAAFATRWAVEFGQTPVRYRGSAPVPHWGIYHPLVAEGAEAVAPGARSRSSRPRRGAKLPRPLVRRQPDPSAAERPGPFLLPFADPHLSVDDPGGLVRPPDGSRDEDPETLAEELARLGQLPVTRDDAWVHETIDDGSPMESTGSRGAAHGSAKPMWLYPEWDCARNAYRNPGCCVRELAPSGADGGWAEAVLAARRILLARLRRQLDGLRPGRQRLRRQLDGDDLDLSAWVDDWADRRAERAPADRVYTREQPRRRDVAVTLLLDASGSTESWLAERHRVIDVVKEAALVFAEALTTLGDRFALLAFSGQSAADVRVRVLKQFDEPAGPPIRRRIGAIEPDAFTRLGGALRHATAGLARERARARLLLLLSDGKPQDEDGYEGTYGIEDVRQAVAEARLQGVRVFGLTVDREGASYLPRLFGPHGYTVIWNAEALPDRLPAVYRRLTVGA
jgi:nitric oxide reductase NorD protein